MYVYVCMIYCIAGSFCGSTFCEILDKVVRVNLVVVIFLTPAMTISNFIVDDYEL